MKQAILVLALIALPACVRGKVQEKKSALNMLNGEHYESPVQATGAGGNAIVALPVLHAKVNDTIVTGKLTIEDPLAVVPNDLSLQLWSEGKLVSETHPAKTGDFQLKGDFANGFYMLKVASKKYRGERDLRIEGFNIEGVDITAEKR